MTLASERWPRCGDPEASRWTFHEEVPRRVAKLEGEKGFEPTTLCLGSICSRFADRRSAVLLERKLQ